MHVVVYLFCLHIPSLNRDCVTYRSICRLRFEIHILTVLKEVSTPQIYTGKMVEQSEEVLSELPKGSVDGIVKLLTVLPI